jgi:predicted GH43/DUF377 family glycosyl hydrolase
VGKDGVSVIKHRMLQGPTQLGKEVGVLIKPALPEESFGCEDPRITKIGRWFYITYTAYDGVNARIGIARTRNFAPEDVEKLGFFGPQIELETAVKLTKGTEYGEKWKDQIEKAKKRKEELGLEVPVLLWDKDASVHYKKGEWILIHRLEPNMHIAKADKLEHLKNQEFWIDYLKNITENEWVRAENGEEKVGLGSPLTRLGGRFIGTYHTVSQKNNRLDYYGSFLEADKDLRVRSLLRNPLFEPFLDEHILNESDENGLLRRTKK